MNAIISFGLVAAALANWIGPAAACVTPKQTASGPPYAEFDLVNECRGDAIVHWTRTEGKGKPEPGKWFVSGCKTAHQQYFPGKYDFGDVEFPRGGENEKCLPKEDAARRTDVPQQHPSSQAPKSSGTQKSSGTDTPSSPKPATELSRRIEQAKKQAETAPQKNQQYEEQLRTEKQIEQERYRIEKDKNERAQQAATEAKERDAKLRDEQTERDFDAAKEWLCFSTPTKCYQMCNLASLHNLRDAIKAWKYNCHNGCDHPSFQRYCVNIHPEYRAQIYDALREHYEPGSGLLRDLPPE